MANQISQMLALLVTTTLLGNPAWAQNPAPSAPAQTARPERGGTVQVERRISGLQRRLKITPEEQPQWDAFAGVMRQNSARMETLQQERADKVATMSASEDMRSYADVARAHADDLQRLAAAFDTLYAAMTPEQKAEADRTFHQFQGRGRVRPQP